MGKTDGDSLAPVITTTIDKGADYGPDLCPSGGHRLVTVTTATTDPLPAPPILQAAAWLGADPKTLRRYIAQCRINAMRQGPRLMRVGAQ